MTDILNSLTLSWHSFNFSLALVIFLAYFFIDALYAYYTMTVVKREALKSASAGALMHFLLAFGVINYVQNYLYIVPIAIGSFLGTYLIVKTKTN